MEISNNNENDDKIKNVKTKSLLNVIRTIIIQDLFSVTTRIIDTVSDAITDKYKTQDISQDTYSKFVDVRTKVNTFIPFTLNHLRNSEPDVLRIFNFLYQVFSTFRNSLDTLDDIETITNSDLKLFAEEVFNKAEDLLQKSKDSVLDYLDKLDPDEENELFNEGFNFMVDVIDCGDTLNKETRKVLMEMSGASSHNIDHLQKNVSYDQPSPELINNMLKSYGIEPQQMMLPPDQQGITQEQLRLEAERLGFKLYRPIVVCQLHPPSTGIQCKFPEDQ